MASLEEIITREKKNRIKWGFVWVFLTAVFWGAGYVPIQTVWSIPEAATGFGISGAAGNIIASLLVSALMAIIFILFLAFVWCGSMGKIKDSVQVLTNWRVSKWIFIGAICGGPVAIFGSLLCSSYLGAAFSAAVGLLSAVIGAFLGRVLNKEKLSKNAIIGIAVILIGGIIILNPVDIANEIMNPASDGVMLGYLGAIASFIGWGFEGNMVVRSLDLTDTDASMPIRYLFESLIWVCIAFPVAAVLLGGEFIDALVMCFTDPAILFWILICAATLGMCYVCQYKSFATLGVGRTLSIQSFYVPISFVLLFIFMGVPLGVTLVIGAIIAVIGVFVMYKESSSLMSSNRSLEGE